MVAASSSPRDQNHFSALTLFPPRQQTLPHLRDIPLFLFRDARPTEFALLPLHLQGQHDQAHGAAARLSVLAQSAIFLYDVSPDARRFLFVRTV